MTPGTATRLAIGLGLAAVGFASGYLFRETAEQGDIASSFPPVW